mgnify:CR=1 FL=1
MYIERRMDGKFNKLKQVYNIIAIVGARQAGKTTFLKEHGKGYNSSYVLFDDPDARALFEEDIKKFEIQYIEGFDYCILDEVQYCNDSGRNLKYLADKDSKMWISASSEIILSKNILSYLVCRFSVMKLYPFSLQELLVLKKQRVYSESIISRIIWEHMIYGGYPKVVLTEDKELKNTILKDLYQTMVLKDIAQTFSIEDIKSLELFIKYLVFNIGSILSYDSVSKDLSISFQTVKKYLSAMEKSYLIKMVSPFYKNKTKEITKQPKTYFIDTGLRNVIAGKLDIDGKLFENYVLSELIKLGLEVKYWRTKAKAEVDFVIEKGDSIIPIEVKINSLKKTERSLRSFIETYNPKKAIVVCYKGETGKMKLGDCNILFTDVFGMIKELEK